MEIPEIQLSDKKELGGEEHSRWMEEQRHRLLSQEDALWKRKIVHHGRALLGDCCGCLAQIHLISRRPGSMAALPLQASGNGVARCTQGRPSCFSWTNVGCSCFT